MGIIWPYSSDCTFEAGARAGDLLMELCVELCPRLEARCNEFLSEARLSPLYDYISGLGDRDIKVKVPYVNGFLSRIVKPTELECSDITLWGIDNIIHNQTQYATICNFPKHYRLFQFGYWYGDQSDGDGWCLDMQDDCIHCVPVPVGANPEIDPAIDPHRTRRDTYAVFPQLDSLAAYLRCSMQRRGKV